MQHNYYDGDFDEHYDADVKVTYWFLLCVCGN